MSNTNLSSNLQRIIQQYLNQSPDYVSPPRQQPPHTRGRDPFSMSQILPMMDRYHTIIEDYQNMFRLVILMASLEQASQQLQQQQPQQPQQQRPQTRNPVYDYSTRRTSTSTATQRPNTPMETAQRHNTPTEPGDDTQQQQTVSFVDVVVEIDEPLETIGNNETNLQSYISNMFQSESFRNNLFQNTGLTAPTNNSMQWYTTFSNRQANNNSNNNTRMEEEESGLTNEQIENCTRRITYRDNDNTELLSHTCPITMEDFREGDVLLQLTVCSHAFREMDLLRWFVTHSTCPVCRHSYRNLHLND